MEQNHQKSNLQRTAEAANTVKGAIKTGKAIAGSAKGAALGPYGLAASLVWTNRALVGKIIISLIFLLMIPVLFILMLPSLIFGGLSNGFSEGTIDVPVLNDNIEIVENVNEISFAINSILSEGIDDVIVRINDDFSSLDADGIEIINPYENNATSNINLFISQYCAYKGEDFQSISTSDMESILNNNISKLYYYTKTTEVRPNTTINEETGEEIITNETWVVYKIIYNGEHYFADNIFNLTDEQKELSFDYASNLSLFLGNGMFQGITGFNTIPALGDIRFTDGATEVVYFNQLDSAYANMPYGTDNIGGYACGPTSMSIVISSLTSEIIDPIRMSEWAYQNGYWCKGSGSYHSLIPGCATHFGLSVEGCTASEPQRIVDGLTEGKLVVALMSKGHFTSGGHFIVLRDVTSDGKILVADPASYERSQKSWDLSIILNEASHGAAAGGPFWIIG